MIWERLDSPPCTRPQRNITARQTPCECLRTSVQRATCVSIRENDAEKIKDVSSPCSMLSTHPRYTASLAQSSLKANCERRGLRTVWVPKMNDDDRKERAGIFSPVCKIRRTSRPTQHHFDRNMLFRRLVHSHRQP